MQIYTIQLWHVPIIIIGVLLLFGAGYWRGRVAEMRWYDKKIKPYQNISENED